jgi:cobalt-zinc-cadmium efflux system membrane fusion protein
VAVLAALAVGVFFLSAAIARRANPVVSGPSPEPLPSGYFKPTEDQWQSLAIAPVKEMAFGDVSDTEGTIAPADDTTAQIFSPFTGRVTNVFVTVGDYARKGMPLFAGEGDESAQALNDLAATEQSLAAAQVQLHITEANRTRLLKLLRVDGAARKDVEQSKADLAAAVAIVKNDEIAVSLVRSRLRVLNEGSAAGKSLGGSPRAPALPTTVIVRAPIDGLITQRALGNGQYLQSAANGGSNALLTISGLERVFFVGNVTESQIARIHPGDSVAVSLLAFPGRIFQARIKYIAPSVDPNTHRIAVRAEVDNPDDSLRPGMFGTLRITTGPPSQAVAVPEDAVIFEGDTARVWIVGPNRTLAVRYFTAGKTVDNMVEAVRGLRRGDRVVTHGSVFIDRAAQGDD